MMYSARPFFLIQFAIALAACSVASTSGADQLPDGWRAVAGNWRVDDGVIVADSLNGETRVTFGKDSWQNYEVEVNATFLETHNDSRWLAVVFRAAHDGSEPWSQFPIRLKTSEHSGAEFAVRKDGRWDVRLRVRDKRD